MAEIDFYSRKPDVTKELIKTKKSSKSTRLEYLRMRNERAVESKQATGKSLSVTDTAPRRLSITTEEVVQQQHEEPEVTSFPFTEATDSVDGVGQKNKDGTVKAMEANEHPGQKHGARLCMISAMIHMKCLATRKAKSIKQLRKNPRTTMDDMKKETSIVGDDDDDSSDGEVGQLDYLKNCRYLRGQKEDQELSVEDIFS